jgi:hypothetical protein
MQMSAVIRKVGSKAGYDNQVPPCFFLLFAYDKIVLSVRNDVIRTVRRVV